MIKRMIIHGYRHKSLLAMILAVFFWFFIFLLHMEEVMPEAQVSKENICKSQTSTTDRDANDMASANMDRELFFGSVLVSESFFNTNEQVFHGYYGKGYNGAVLRFVLHWSVIWTTIILSMGYLYIIRRERNGYARCFLQRILHYIHELDGKKAV